MQHSNVMTLMTAKQVATDDDDISDDDDYYAMMMMTHDDAESLQYILPHRLLAPAKAAMFGV